MSCSVLSSSDVRVGGGSANLESYVEKSKLLATRENT